MRRPSCSIEAPSSHGDEAPRSFGKTGSLTAAADMTRLGSKASAARSATSEPSFIRPEGQAVESRHRVARGSAEDDPAVPV